MLWDLFAIGAGPIIGIGWISTVGIWLAQAGALGACLAFVLGGAAILAIGFCYAEMAALCIGARGEIDYTLWSLGSNYSFVAAWLLLLTYVSACAFEAISVGWIAGLFATKADTPVAYVLFGETQTWVNLWAGMGGTLLITLVNLMGPKTLGRFQRFVTFGKLLLLFSFVIAGISLGNESYLQPAFVHGWSGLLAVLVTTPYFLAGFNAVAMAFGEKSNNVSPAILAVVLIVVIVLGIAFYALVAIAVAMSTPRSVLLSAPLPTFAAFSSTFGLRGAQMMLIAGSLALMSAWNALFYASSRVLQTLAERQFLPEALGKATGRPPIPRRAVFTVGLLVAIGTLLGKGAIVPILGASSSCIAVTFSLVTLGTLAARLKRPTLERRFRIPGGTMTVILACAISVSLAGLTLIQPITRPGCDAWPLEWSILCIWALLGVALRPWRAKVVTSEADAP